MTPLDSELAITWVTRLTAFAAVLTSAELLARPSTVAPGGLMDWNLAKLYQPMLTHGTLARALDRVFAPAGLRWLLGARIATAVVMAAAPLGPLAGTAAALSFVLTCALAVRCSWGHDGADQMLVLTFGALIVAGLGGTTARAAALWFIAGQLVLAYFVAGIAKLSARGWRDGSALAAVFATRIYGHAAVAHFLSRHRGFTFVAAWGIIGFETVYPVIVIAPRPLAWCLIAVGLAFHLSAAVFMGLNTFLWAFAAAYPALLWICKLPV